MKLINLYSHNGSKNHGCEAIVRGITKILKGVGDICLYSFNKDEDISFNLQQVVPITQTQVKRHNIKQSGTSIKGRIKHFLKQFLPISFIMKIQKKINMGAYQDIAKAKGDLFLSIGGDIYCYDSYAVLDYLNIELNKTSKTALIGCSITPERIKQDKNLRADLQRYSLIIARESITYKALIENGINKNTHLFPDPAFALDTQETPLPNTKTALNEQKTIKKLTP